MDCPSCNGTLYKVESRKIIKHEDQVQSLENLHYILHVLVDVDVYDA